MPLGFSNYGGGFLAANMTAGQTTLTLGAGQGATFPSTAGGVTFYVTLIDQASFATQSNPPVQREIVLCTARAGDVLTVTRGQDGTTGQIWAFNDRAELRLNAAALNLFGSGTNVNYLAPYTGSVVRTGTSKWSDVVSVKDFGAVGDGVADDTVAIQAALNAGAGRILFPQAVYRTTATLTYTGLDRAVIEGNGSIITLDEATGTLSTLQIGAWPGNRVFGVVVKDLLLQRAQVATAGAGVHVFGGSGCKLENVTANGANKLFYGFWLDRAIDCWMLNCLAERAVSHGVRMEGTNTTTDACNAHIFDCEIQYNGGSGIRVFDFVMGGSFFRNTIFANVSNGIVMQPVTPGNSGGDFEISENNIDSNVIGFFTQEYGNIRLNDNWFSSNTSNCISLGDITAQVVMTGNLIFVHAGATGISVASDNNVITGNFIAFGAAGILFTVAAQRTVITGNVIFSVSGWAVDTSNGPDRVAVVGNVFQSNTSGNVRPGATNLVVAGNVPDTDTSTQLNISGNVTLATIGNGLVIKSGANARIGTATLVGGTVTVNNTSVTANTQILVTCRVQAGTPGFLRVSAITIGTNFTILSSSGTDTSTVSWLLVEATP